MSTREYHLREYNEHRYGTYLHAMFKGIELPPGGTFLDLGSGSGYVNAYVAERWKPARNIGLEIDEEALRLAKELNASHAIGWVQGSAEMLPLRDASVDLLVCRVVIPLTEVEKVIAEIGRILRPGGKAVLSLHSWKFYLRWLSLNPAKWKRSAAGLLHFGLGAWFNLTGRQVRPKWKGHPIGQTFQTMFRMRRLLAGNGMRITAESRQQEMMIYVEKTADGTR